MVLVPDLYLRLAFAAGGYISRGLDTMKKMTKLQKYHADYVSMKRVEKVLAVTPEAVEIEKRAIEREKSGHYRIASRLWLECMDAASGEVERARIAARRTQCITRSNGLRQGEYSGVNACHCGVIYD